MNISSRMRAQGSMHIQLFGPDGKLKCERRIHNLIVTSGKNWMASRMADGGQNQMSHMAVGSGNAAPAVGDTALAAELGRIALTSAVVSNNTITYTANFAAGVGTGAVVEAGLFNAGAGGVMLARTTFSVINKGAADFLLVSWVVTQS